EQDLVGATCLPGDWVLDNASMKALFTAAGGDIVEVSGEVLTSYRADGTWLTQYTEWTTVAKDAKATTTMVRNGDDHGTYRVADDSGLTLVTNEMNSVLVMTLAMPGQPEVSTTIPGEMTPSDDVTFHCDSETLSVMSEGSTTTFTRRG